MTKRHIVWEIRETSQYFHVSNGRAYGPSLRNEKLEEYKARVRHAYGSLVGIKFGTKSELHPAYFYK